MEAKVRTAQKSIANESRMDFFRITKLIIMIRIIHFIVFNHKIVGYVPPKCINRIEWALTKGKYKKDGNVWYDGMKKKTGVELRYATYEDFQRLFKCKGIWKEDCNEKGLEFPLLCSYPPCDNCEAKISGTYLYYLI